MPKEEIIVQHAVGLHARPAAIFVRLAASFPASINVHKADQEGRSANAKSILSILTLGVNQGDKIVIETDGEGAEEAMKALLDLIQSNFGENIS